MLLENVPVIYMQITQRNITFIHIKVPFSKKNPENLLFGCIDGPI